MTERERLQYSYELAFHPPRLNELWNRVKRGLGVDEQVGLLLDQARLLHQALPEEGYASQRALTRLALYQARARAFGMVRFLDNVRRHLNRPPLRQAVVPGHLVRDIGLPPFCRPRPGMPIARHHNDQMRIMGQRPPPKNPQCALPASRLGSGLYFGQGLSHLVAPMTWCLRTRDAMVVGLGLAAALSARAAEPMPSFKEVYDLVKTNLVDTDQGRLERAAVEGLLQQLSPRVLLVTNGQAEGSGPGRPALARTSVYDGSCGYLRVGCFGPALTGDLESAVKAMAATNRIKGWVLDLRFADGSDYQAAARIADRFVAKEQPLLDCGQGVIRSKAKERPPQEPLMVLVNRQTSGAAEALAGILRKTGSALLLGTNTAGQAFVTKDFPLQTGQHLRVATALVKIGDGEPLPRQGVRPDIVISVKPADEQAYFEDPYKVLSKPYQASLLASDDPFLAGLSTNRNSRRRINEADLVRILREGGDFETEGPSTRPTESPVPVLRDPVMARAIDLLKGLAVVRRPIAE